MHQSILFHPLANKCLIPNLIKFYSDVECTGSHTEFFDKFKIRQHLQVVRGVYFCQYGTVIATEFHLKEGCFAEVTC